MTCLWFGVTYIADWIFRFLNIVSVLTLQKTLRITAVSVALILHKHIYGFALCCVQLCSCMRKDVQFDSSSGINQQSCHRKVRYALYSYAVI